MDPQSPGYVFETVFWIEREAAGPPSLVAHSVNGKESARRIRTTDRRVLPGQRVKVKVEEVSGESIQVTYLGLAEFVLKEDIYVDPVLLQQFEILLCSGRSILLDGPQGTGKTTISRALAESLGMEYVFFNCSVCFEPADFVGTLQLRVDENGQARTEWLPSDVLAAIDQASSDPGRRFLVFLDELNRCRSYALNGIMSAIDSSRRIFDPRRNTYSAIPDNVQWIAAINNGKQFAGTYKIDVAQMDRFAVLKIDYPPEEKEIEILERRYDMVKRKHVRQVVRIANLIRSDERIETDLSMRATDEACLFLSYPRYVKSLARDELVHILETSFCNRLPGRVEEEGSEARAAFELVERNVLLDHLAAES